MIVMPNRADLVVMARAPPGMFRQEEIAVYARQFEIEDRIRQAVQVQTPEEVRSCMEPSLDIHIAACPHVKNGGNGSFNIFTDCSPKFVCLCFRYCSCEYDQVLPGKLNWLGSGQLLLILIANLRN